MDSIQRARQLAICCDGTNNNLDGWHQPLDTAGGGPGLWARGVREHGGLLFVLDAPLPTGRPALHFWLFSRGIHGAQCGGSGQPVWFRGAHCDVGGGFVQGQTGISDRALCWLVSEAVQCELALQHEGVVLDSDKSYPVQSVEHASVTAYEYHFQQNTVWFKPRSKKGAAIGLVAILLCMLAYGEALNANPFAGSLDWQAIAARLGEDFAQNTAFARWQLLWWQGDNLGDVHHNFGSPLWALMWDTGLIDAYAYVLSWFSVAAFARHVGLRRVTQTATPWLNTLGWALPVAVDGVLPLIALPARQASQR